jgi:hypothetical protein
VTDVRELLGREVAPEEYQEIRELWKRHSIAEDERNLPGLISTLTEDCVYEVVGAGRTWQGHDGAAQFYTQLLAAFPDIRFDLTNIVIGPQGVCEEAAGGSLPHTRAIGWSIAARGSGLSSQS